MWCLAVNMQYRGSLPLGPLQNCFTVLCPIMINAEHLSLSLGILWWLRVKDRKNYIVQKNLLVGVLSETLTELRAGEGEIVSKTGWAPPSRPCSSWPPIGPEPGYCALIGPGLSLWFIWQKMLLARFLFDLEWPLEMSNATGVSSIICESSAKMIIQRIKKKTTIAF